MTPRGAFCELQGSASGYDHKAGALAVYQEGHVALPPVDQVGSSLFDLVDGEDRLFLDSRERMLLSASDACERITRLDIDQLYIDPILSRSNTKYVKFIHELHDKGVVKFGVTAKSQIGMVFVKKKWKTQVDFRYQNCKLSF